MTRVLGSFVLVVVLLFGVAWAFGLVNLQQTRDARLPRISVEGGQLPRFNVDAARVDVGTKTETVRVPEVNVRDHAIEVPSVEVQKPAK